MDCVGRYRGYSEIDKQLQHPPVTAPGLGWARTVVGRERDEAWRLAGQSASMRKEVLQKATEETPDPSFLNNK